MVRRIAELSSMSCFTKHLLQKLSQTRNHETPSLIQENPNVKNTDGELLTSISQLQGEQPSSEGNLMANFVVNPVLFAPEGLQIEKWVRPARGCIVILGNPPRRHDDYAIATVFPLPQQNQLYAAMDEVIDFLRKFRVCIVSALSVSAWFMPASVWFSCQSAGHASPHQLDDVREIVVEEHDRGINMRACPFSHTCWGHVPCFSVRLTKYYVSQAVNHFGSVITWTNLIASHMR